MISLLLQIPCSSLRHVCQSARGGVGWGGEEERKFIDKIEINR